MISDLSAHNPFALLTLIVAPAVRTNAMSVLALSTSNRFLRAGERLLGEHLGRGHDHPPARGVAVNFSRTDTRRGTVRRDALGAMTNDQTRKPPPKLDQLLQRAGEFARREPTRATVSAFGVGFLLNLLPLSAIAAALVGLAFALLRPALLFLGLFKACELCRSKIQPVSRHE